MPLERMKLRDSRQRNLVLKCNNVKDETMRLAAEKEHKRRQTTTSCHYLSAEIL